MNIKDKTVYQIYPKSFYDSNRDGLGDLLGVCQKMDYLEKLGVDFIWLTPFFTSPQRDNGYDVADYCQVDERYGTMADFEMLCQEAKKRNIDIMLDMVFNHTSIQHVWFQKALAGDEKYQRYYFFRKGKDGQLPNNWQSKFGGNAWEYVEALDLYYLHLFDVTQADLDWSNPEVRQEMVEIVKFWRNKGVKGFRFDVVNLISKGSFEDDPHQFDGRQFYTDGPHVHEYLKELNLSSFGDEEVMTVGEMSGTNIDDCIGYSGKNSHELSSVFTFHHLKVDYKDKKKWELMEFDFQELKDLLNDWQVELQKGEGWNASFWCNHDQPRALSRFGNDKTYHKESAKMLATTIHCLRGTPYIYQGEEIGMTNAYFDDIALYRDVESINYFEILKQQGKSLAEIYTILQARSRDNSRTPMQWNNQASAGFTKAKPWIPVIENYPQINVEAALKDEDSIFYHYQKLIQLRKQYKIIQEGIYRPLLQKDHQVFAYQREYNNESLIVVNHFYDSEWKINLAGLADYQILLSNYPDSKAMDELILRPYESIIFYKNDSVK